MVEHRSPKPGVGGSIPLAPAKLYNFMNPIEFLRQVKKETKSVVWSTRKETINSTAMVLVLVLITSIFFLVVDAIIFNIIQAILGL